MALQSDHSPTLVELLGSLAGDITGLFRKEIQLAKAEASEKFEQVMGGVQAIVIGAVLLLGALGVLLAGIVTLLASIMVGFGLEPTLANAISAGIVTLVIGLIGWSALNRGLSAMKASNINMDRTAHSLAQDAQVVKETF